MDLHARSSSSAPSPHASAVLLGRAADRQADMIDRLAPAGWQRYALLAAARANRGDTRGMADALGVLVRMVADEHGGTARAVADVELAVGAAGWPQSFGAGTDPAPEADASGASR